MEHLGAVVLAETALAEYANQYVLRPLLPTGRASLSHSFSARLTLLLDAVFRIVFITLSSSPFRSLRAYVVFHNLPKYTIGGWPLSTSTCARSLHVFGSFFAQPLLLVVLLVAPRVFYQSIFDGCRLPLTSSTNYLLVYHFRPLHRMLLQSFIYVASRHLTYVC